MRVLGIDPGLATVGLGIIETTSPHDLRVVEWLTIKTPAGLPLPDRLLEIQTDMRALLQDCHPQLVVIERLFFAANEQSALEVAQARGVLVVCAAEHGATVIDATPLQLKLAITGDGQADKRQVQDMVVRLLKLKEIPRPVDAADALALAIYGALQAPVLELTNAQSR